jgi:hypothetical protein
MLAATVGDDMIKSIVAFVALAFAQVALAAALPVNKVHSWVCSFEGYGEAKGVLTLIRDGSVLRIGGAEFIAYDIVQDNEVGIVAVKSYAEVEGDLKHLGADVLVIDKTTMAFRKGNVFAPGIKADNRVRAGTCRKKE